MISRLVILLLLLCGCSHRGGEQAYFLPFEECRGYQIVQGFHGRFSHRGAHAVDWRMLSGSVVAAARDGVVLKTRSDAVGRAYSGTGRSPPGNFIIIDHEDSTYSRYLHLATDGVFVKPGQFVKAGESIGLSGDTGYSYGAHLHFDVVTDPYSGSRTIPFKLIDESGEPQDVVEGRTYWQACP